MNELSKIAISTGVMSTIDFRIKINELRLTHEEKAIRNNDFIAKVEDEIDDLPPYEIFVSPSNGKSIKFYRLTKKQLMLVGMRESKLVRKGIADFIDQQDNNDHQLPQTYSQALRAYADEVEQNELHKSKITSLEESLDTSEQWVSILRAAQERGIKETSFNWRVLKQFSIDMGIEIKKVPCPRFKTKNLYHVSVFNRCYPL